MYVNYYDRFVKIDTENRTIGINFSKDKKDTLVEITLLKIMNRFLQVNIKLSYQAKKNLKN